MLAYAAQGLADDRSSPSGTQLRPFLERADAALGDVPRLFKALIKQDKLKPVDRYAAFGKVMEADARAARAALQLVIAQEAISSQLIDNLNASIHLRALLTDLFLIDEMLKARR